MRGFELHHRLDGVEVRAKSDMAKARRFGVSRAVSAARGLCESPL
jgi:hypothetical protein